MPLTLELFDGGGTYKLDGSEAPIVIGSHSASWLPKTLVDKSSAATKDVVVLALIRVALQFKLLINFVVIDPTSAQYFVRPEARLVVLERRYGRGSGLCNITRYLRPARQV
jgi:hypothetical protein